MRIIKRVNGYDVDLILKIIKNYPSYGLYQIYKKINGKYVALYKECFTDLDIQKIVLDGFVIEEEIFS